MQTGEIQGYNLLRKNKEKHFNDDLMLSADCQLMFSYFSFPFFLIIFIFFYYFLE